jgi:formamidopyrimidine-DNA glycosylase
MTLNFGDYNDVHECAGRNCPNEGTQLLTVMLVQRNGWFCNACSGSLLKLALAQAVEK